MLRLCARSHTHTHTAPNVNVRRQSVCGSGGHNFDMTNSIGYKLWRVTVCRWCHICEREEHDCHSVVCVRACIVHSHGGRRARARDCVKTIINHFPLSHCQMGEWHVNKTIRFKFKRAINMRVIRNRMKSERFEAVVAVISCCASCAHRHSSNWATLNTPQMYKTVLFFSLVYFGMPHRAPIMWCAAPHELHWLRYCHSKCNVISATEFTIYTPREFRFSAASLIALSSHTTGRGEAANILIDWLRAMYESIRWSRPRQQQQNSHKFYNIAVDDRSINAFNFRNDFDLNWTRDKMLNIRRWWPPPVDPIRNNDNGNQLNEITKVVLSTGNGLVCVCERIGFCIWSSATISNRMWWALWAVNNERMPVDTHCSW